MKTSFPEILHNSKLVIPIIQRDYAQGRSDHKTQRVRKDFLDAIFGILKKRTDSQSATQNLELDFIYGFNTRDEYGTIFSPIDGQQRLTTFWLIWWFVGAKEGVTDKAFLANFIYETRHSSTVFCEQLLAFQPHFNIANIEKEIKNQSWYFENWDYDPGIRSMLVMLNDIEERYAALRYDDLWSIINHTSSPFYFYKLDMDRIGLPDDLYIKMNSRGKPLTEFEYFKANFSEIIADDSLRSRFQHSIDQEWAEAIWKIVTSSVLARQVADLSIEVDNAFIRLINFITDVLAYRQDMPFTDIVSSPKEAQKIYEQEINLRFLFDVLDAIVVQQNEAPNFWDDLFYLDKAGFSPGKTRLFFQGGHVNLLERCLFRYIKNGKDFSYAEQILLYACLVHRLESTSEFDAVARIMRNLVANSSNELRGEDMGRSLVETNEFVRTRNFAQLVHFKTDQIREEMEKFTYIKSMPAVAADVHELEDSDLLRGCISIFDLDERFTLRKDVFLELFAEDLIETEFISRANVLLCFGDYSQDNGNHTNLLARSRSTWRTFLTTPAFNKAQLADKTKVVLMDCLDYFVGQSSSASVSQKINSTLEAYKTGPKDWKYYFLKYSGFRNGVNQGYYIWDEVSPYPLLKMKEKRFSGYYWDPFLVEIKTMAEKINMELDYGEKILIFAKDDLLFMESRKEGLSISNGNSNGGENVILETLITHSILSPEGCLMIEQDVDGIDLEDRIEKAGTVIRYIEHLIG